MSSAFRLIQIGGKSWTAGVKASGLGVRTWSRRAPTATRTKPRDRSSIRWTPSAITATSHEPGRSSSSTTRTASLKRTYVWAILGALAQTRSNILKAGTGFDAQKQFLANVEDAIASPVDIPSSITRYQKTLQYASTPPDCVFGLELYLAPSDMALHPGNVQGYNNEIVIAGSVAAIGRNPGINESELIHKTAGDQSFEGKIAAPAGTDHMGPPSGRPAGSPTPAANAPVAPQQHASSRAAATSHEEEKTALIAAGVGVGLLALWLVSR